MVQGYLKEIQMKFQGSFKCLSECFKEVSSSRVFQEILEEEFQRYFKNVSSFKGSSREKFKVDPSITGIQVFQECFKF